MRLRDRQGHPPPRHEEDRAIEQNPGSAGLYVGGGAWLSLPVVEFLEKEFDIPCISNQNSVMWDSLHQIDFWKPTTVSNRLMAGRERRPARSSTGATFCTPSRVIALDF